jgi:hypothetical protein
MISHIWKVVPGWLLSIIRNITTLHALISAQDECSTTSSCHIYRLNVSEFMLLCKVNSFAANIDGVRVLIYFVLFYSLLFFLLFFSLFLSLLYCFCYWADGCAGWLLNIWLLWPSLAPRVCKAAQLFFFTIKRQLGRFSLPDKSGLSFRFDWRQSIIQSRKIESILFDFFVFYYYTFLSINLLYIGKKPRTCCIFWYIYFEH